MFFPGEVSFLSEAAHSRLQQPQGKRKDSRGKQEGWEEEQSLCFLAGSQQTARGLALASHFLGPVFSNEYSLQATSPLQVMWRFIHLFPTEEAQFGCCCDGAAPWGRLVSSQCKARYGTGPSLSISPMFYYGRGQMPFTISASPFHELQCPV